MLPCLDPRQPESLFAISESSGVENEDVGVGGAEGQATRASAGFTHKHACSRQRQMTDTPAVSSARQVFSLGSRRSCSGVGKEDARVP